MDTLNPSAPLSCIASRHVAFEGLGVFGAELRRHSYAVEYRQAGCDPMTQADWDQTDLVVVLGGPIGANETARYPWLVHEIEHMRQRVRARHPLLGLPVDALTVPGRLYTAHSHWAGHDAPPSGPLGPRLAPFGPVWPHLAR